MFFFFFSFFIFFDFSSKKKLFLKVSMKIFRFFFSLFFLNRDKFPISKMKAWIGCFFSFSRNIQCLRIINYSKFMGFYKLKYELLRLHKLTTFILCLMWNLMMEMRYSLRIFVMKIPYQNCRKCGEVFNFSWLLFE